MFEFQVLIDGADVAGLTLAGASIRYGRESLFEQPSPASASLTLLTRDAAPDLAAAWPEFGLGEHSMPSGFVDEFAEQYEGPRSRITLGTSVQVVATNGTRLGMVETFAERYEGASHPRITGRVVAIDYTRDAIRLTIVGPAEQLSRLHAPASRPAESDTARIAALAAHAGIAVEIDGAPGPVLAAYVEPDGTWTTVATRMSEAAASGGGLLIDDRDGRVRYRSAAWDDAVTVQVPPFATPTDTLAMSADLANVVTVVHVEYGPADARATVTVRDGEQAALYGERERTFQTVLAAEADAHAFALRMLTALSPTWTMPALPVALALTDDAQIDALAGLLAGDALLVPQLLPGSPAPDYAATVLGITETLSLTGWQITYSLAKATQ